MATVFVGYTTVALPGWEQFAPEAKAPSNYKDPDKIRAYVDEVRKRQAQEAADRVMTGAVNKLVVLRGGETHTLDGSMPDWAVKLFGFVEKGDYLVGIRVLPLLRFAVVDCITKKLPYPWWAVRSEVFGTALLTASEEVKVIDPIRAIVGGSAMDSVDLKAILSRLGLPVNGTPGTAEWMAQAAFVYGSALGL